MYKIMKINDRVMTAMSVAPPSHRDLPDDIRELSNTHFFTSQNISLSPFNKHILALSTEQTDQARLQFLHAMKEIKEKINDDSFSVFKFKNLDNLVLKFAKDIQADILTLQNKCENSPKSKPKAKTLNEAMGVLYEAILCLEKNTDPQWTNHITEVFTLQKTIDTAHNHLTNEIGKLYPNLKENLSPIERLKEKAHESLIKQLEYKKEIDFSLMDRTIAQCGDRDLLWVISQNEENKNEAIQNGYYYVLKDTEADQIKTFMTDLFTSFSTYQSNGIIDSLRMYGTLLNWEAYKYSQKTQKNADATLDASIAGEKELDKRILSGPKYVELTADERSQKIEQLVEDKLFVADYSKGLLQLQQKLNIDIEFYADQFNVDTIKEVTLTLTNEGTSILGTWSDNRDEVIVIFDDAINHDVAENAVYMSRLPKASINNGIPEFNEQFRTEHWGKSSNFYSLADAILELKGNAEKQNHFSGTSFKIRDYTSFPKAQEIITRKLKV